MDINKALRTAISSGEVCIGMKETKKALAAKKAKLLIASSSLPAERLRELKASETPIYTFKGTNMDLGFACGKPFSISVLAVIAPGGSDILALKGD